MIRFVPSRSGRQPQKLISPVLLVVLLFTAHAADGGPTPPTPASALPRVLSVQGRLALGEPVDIRLEHLAAWLNAGNASSQLALFLNEREMPGSHPEAVDSDTGLLRFHLHFTPDNSESWDDLLRKPVLVRPVALSVGPRGGTPFPSTLTGENRAKLVLVPSPWGLISLLLVVGVGALLVWLGRTTSLLRDPAAGVPAMQRSYSLARTQAAFWFFIIFAAYATLWLLTGALDTITESMLGLMGISSATLLAGAMVDSGKRQAEAANAAGAGPNPGSTQPGPSAPAASPPTAAPNTGCTRGFLHDILSDGEGYSFHRFQMFAWTLVLGLIFVASVYNSLKMPEFSPTLLGLMGISSGTYLGLKFPEK